MNNILNRIQKVMNELANSRTDFCKDTGINHIHLKQIFLNQRQITYNHIYKISQAYPQLSTDWLISGEGKLKKAIPDIGANQIKVNIRITKDRKVSLIIERQNEYHYRQAGSILHDEIKEYKDKIGLSEEKALYFLGYIYAKKLSANNPKVAYQLFSSIRLQYTDKTPMKHLNTVVAYHLAFKYYCTTINKTI